MITVTNPADRMQRNPCLQFHGLVLMPGLDYTRIKPPSTGLRQPYSGDVSRGIPWSACKSARSSGRVRPIRTQDDRNVNSKLLGRGEGKWVVLLQPGGRL